MLCPHCNIVHIPIKITDITIYEQTKILNNIINWGYECVHVIFCHLLHDFKQNKNFNEKYISNISYFYKTKIIKKYILISFIMYDIDYYIKTTFINLLSRTYCNNNGVQY